MTKEKQIKIKRTWWILGNGAVFSKNVIRIRGKEKARIAEWCAKDILLGPSKWSAFALIFTQYTQLDKFRTKQIVHLFRHELYHIYQLREWGYLRYYWYWFTDRARIEGAARDYQATFLTRPDTTIKSIKRHIKHNEKQYNEEQYIYLGRPRR
jgi:hypothetical protein